uniref:Uncharacterized protein n=1 Tax=Trichogramma kaykai TaxID=54128 RepID=A0ABD2WBR2_9HYME
MDFAMPRKNVHKPIKEGLTKALLILQSCYTALDGLEHLPRQNTVEKEVQTSPRPGVQKTLKTAQKTTSTSSNTPPPSAKRSQKGGERDAPKDAKPENSGAATWQQVQRKRRGKKETPAKAKGPDLKAKVKPAGRSRPGVVVVKAKDSKSYAEILKLLRSEPTLQDLVSSVNRVRRSARGELLLQLDKACISPGELGRKLDSAIGDLGSATARTPVTAIEIKDLDEVTTREEICGPSEPTWMVPPSCVWTRSDSCEKPSWGPRVPSSPC